MAHHTLAVNSNRRTACRVRRWSIALSLAGGAVVAAAMIGVGVAQADLATAADVLDSAYTELTDANQVLSQVDVSNLPTLESLFVTLQTGIQDKELNLLGDLQSAEDVISSHDGSLSGLVNDLFTPLDQGWYQASEAVLNANQAFDAAVVSGSGVPAAEFAEIVANLQVLGDTLDSIPVYLAAMLF